MDAGLTRMGRAPTAPRMRRAHDEAPTHAGPEEAPTHEEASDRRLDRERDTMRSELQIERDEQREIKTRTGMHRMWTRASTFARPDMAVCRPRCASGVTHTPPGGIRECAETREAARAGSPAGRGGTYISMYISIYLYSQWVACREGRHLPTAPRRLPCQKILSQNDTVYIYIHIK